MSNTPWSLIALSGQNEFVIMLSLSQLTGRFEEWRFSWLSALFSIDLKKNYVYGCENTVWAKSA